MMLSTRRHANIVASILYAATFTGVFWPSFPIWFRELVMDQSYLPEIVGSFVGAILGIPTGFWLNRLMDSLSRKQQELELTQDRKSFLRFVDIQLNGIRSKIEKVIKGTAEHPRIMPAPIRLVSHDLKNSFEFRLRLFPLVDSTTERFSEALDEFLSCCEDIETAIRMLYDAGRTPESSVDRGEWEKAMYHLTTMAAFEDVSQQYQFWFATANPSRRDLEVLLAKLRVLGILRISDKSRPSFMALLSEVEKATTELRQALALGIPQSGIV